MIETLLIDCAWSKPTAAAIKAAGYAGVLGYISHDAGKDLSAATAKAYRKADLLAGFVFETTADRAKGGRAAGVEDCAFAEAEAAKRGYPEGCVIFYAVDFDATVAQIKAYFQGIKATHARYGWGPYGSARVIDGISKLKPAACWQTVAWSNGVISKHADIYQRAAHSRPAIKGVAGNAYDEDVLIRPIPLWGATTTPAPEPQPKVKRFSRWQRALLRRVTQLLVRWPDPLDGTDDRKAVTGLAAAAEAALKRRKP